MLPYRGAVTKYFSSFSNVLHLRKSLHLRLNINLGFSGEDEDGNDMMGWNGHNDGGSGVGTGTVIVVLRWTKLWRWIQNSLPCHSLVTSQWTKLGWRPVSPRWLCCRQRSQRKNLRWVLKIDILFMFVRTFLEIAVYRPVTERFFSAEYRKSSLRNWTPPGLCFFALFHVDFYPNVTTLRSGLCYRKSACRLSSVACLSSVLCNVRAPYSRGWNFRQYFFTILYLSHPLTSVQNFTEIVPGEPLCQGALNTKGVAK